MLAAQTKIIKMSKDLRIIMSKNFCSFSMFESYRLTNKNLKKSTKKPNYSHKIEIDDLKVNFYWLN